MQLTQLIREKAAYDDDVCTLVCDDVCTRVCVDASACLSGVRVLVFVC